MQKKVTNNYVDNEKFLEAIREYHRTVKQATEEDKPLPSIPNYIGECLYKIAHNYFNKSRFRYYSYEDDMVSEAVLNCLKYFNNFDPDRKNPFAYFTSIVHNSFFQVINSEERSRYKMLKNFTENVLNGNETAFMVSEKLITNEELYDNMYTFMANYEEREKLKKEKKKAKKNLTKLLEAQKRLDNPVE